jgi:hypothetical protein
LAWARSGTWGASLRTSWVATAWDEKPRAWPVGLWLPTPEKDRRRASTPAHSPGSHCFVAFAPSATSPSAWISWGVERVLVLAEAVYASDTSRKSSGTYERAKVPAERVFSAPCTGKSALEKNSPVTPRRSSPLSPRSAPATRNRPTPPAGAAVWRRFLPLLQSLPRVEGLCDPLPDRSGGSGA